MSTLLSRSFCDETLVEGEDPAPISPTSSETSKFDDETLSSEEVAGKSETLFDLHSPEARARALETLRSNPKALFTRGVKKFCLECTGSFQATGDCGGDSLAGGGSCALFQVRTPQLRRSTTKTGVRKAIRANCVQCVGGSDDCCTSPGCSLHAVRFGRRPADQGVST